MVNEVGMTHLLARGFRMDTFFTFFLSSRPFGRFDRYICMAPPFVLWATPDRGTPRACLPAMTDFNRQPGAIDDPGMKGGIDPELDPLPPGDTAGNTDAPGEPEASELDLPGPEDPVAWAYVEPGTDVVGREGVKIGKVRAMLGTETENIFHGVALDPAEGGPARVIPADAVTSLTPSEVQVQVSTEDVESLEEFGEPR